jgi:outer membrane protein insertion porin family
MKMRNLIYILTLGFLLLFQLGKSHAQSDLYPVLELDFMNPKNYVINNIQVEGNQFVDAALIVIYSNLSLGQTITVPGSKVTETLQNLWKQQFFSDVKMYVQELNRGDTVNLIISVVERPRVSKFSFPGLKRAQAKNLREEISLKGNAIITENLIYKTEKEIRDYYYDKGHFNAKVNIEQSQDFETPNSFIFRIFVDRGPKVKLYDFEFVGNNTLSDKKLRKAFKNTARKKNKINIFKSAKFIQEDYDEDKQNLLKVYNAEGFRDMRIVEDQVFQVKENRLIARIKVEEGTQYYFRNIKFTGNTKFSDEVLFKILDIDSGDIYNQSKLDEKLYGSMDGFDISGLYMDDGYLFFNATPLEILVEGNAIDIDIKITEGQQATLRNMIIKGNYKTSDHVILRELRTRPGQKFSRSDIQRTVRELSALGLFDPQQINVVPKPNQADGTVDIEYTVVEKASDQIELSGGIGPRWGGSGSQFVGTLGLVLNNFSSRKLLKTDLWNPIPAGDGQKLSIRGQSSGFFQSYNMSFTEPWMGGKKPNSFTTSIFHSVINGNLRSGADRSAIKTTGASASLGKRLRWPDDNFSILYALTYQQYNVQNGAATGIFPFFDNGQSRTVEMKVVLSRNSLEGGFIFPTGGSNVSLSIAATPPFTLLRGVDPKTLSGADKYKWVEYHKWKFDAEWYTKPFNRSKFVLAARSRTGIMGYYDGDMGFAPFERFRIGGSGLTGAMLFGQEIVSQRGYDEGTISAAATGNNSIGAPMFTKQSIELRYPIIDNPSSTIYLLTFLEGGNAWNSFSTFNPFELRRAAGAGVRLFLPMFGLIGIDYAYGFDYRLSNGVKPNQIHFYIGQQF